MKILGFLLLTLVLVALAESRKKKKKPKQPKKPENPLDRRPDKIKAELYCDSCIAVVKESIKELRGKKKESDVLDVVDNACDPERFYTYHHPPPEMREGCEAFIGGWVDELIDVLVHRNNTDDAVHRLCNEISQACQDVDPANVKPFDDTIMIDGQPTKIGNDKKEDI